MITVRIYENFKAGNIVIKLRGHAQSAQVGEDLVCAAASGYVHQMVETVKTLYQKGWLTKKPRISLESGRANIIFAPVETQRRIVNIMVSMCVTGFEWLADKYPEFIRVNP